MISKRGRVETPIYNQIMHHTGCEQEHRVTQADLKTVYRPNQNPIIRRDMLQWTEFCPLCNFYLDSENFT